MILFVGLVDISGIYFNLEKGNIIEAFKVSSIVAPFETVSSFSATSLLYFTIYLKVYVPWRHRQ
jgi:hypothetical protein